MKYVRVTYIVFWIRLVKLDPELPVVIVGIVIGHALELLLP